MAAIETIYPLGGDSERETLISELDEFRGKDVLLVKYWLYIVRCNGAQADGGGCAHAVKALSQLAFHRRINDRKFVMMAGA
jgi:hypothetical protein